jgi:hypothetical protein
MAIFMVIKGDDEVSRREPDSDARIALRRDKLGRPPDLSLMGVSSFA